MGTDAILAAIVVGGGFYGCSIAEWLARRYGAVVLVEREADLLTRSSYANQARLHGGYHYPRSFTTAHRSRLNFPRFIEAYPEAVGRSFTKLYAIARTNSRVTPRQFEVFCANIGAPLRSLPVRFTPLFDPRTVAAVYEVEEYVFDAARLRGLLREKLACVDVGIELGTSVVSVHSSPECVVVELSSGTELRAHRVINCTYANLNSIRGISPSRARLKHELTELALVSLPKALEGLSVTVMDGPFFSFMPFPARGLTTLSHVRYTPHAAWQESRAAIAPDPIALLEPPPRSAFAFMVRDAARFVPALADAVLEDSLFEIKTVLLANEIDDGRPILLEQDAADERIISVLGSKIDNIYDVLAALENTLAD